MDINIENQKDSYLQTVQLNTKKHSESDVKIVALSFIVAAKYQFSLSRV